MGPMVQSAMDLKMLKDAPVLVTGASGMIGRALVRRLKDAGFTKVLAPSHAELELTDQTAVEAYFAAHKPAFVYHLAAKVGGIQANNTYPGQFIFQNTQMQLNVFEAARKVGVQKILFPGSACTYPKGVAQPVAEEEFLNGRMEPTNIAYGMAKANGLVLAQSYAREYGMKVVLPMPTNTYGVGDNFDPQGGHVIPALMNRMVDAKKAGDTELLMWGTGTPLREFIYVDDVADAFIFLMDKWDSMEIVNVGSGWEISIAELAEKISGVVGFGGTLTNDTSKPDGVMRKCLDSAKLRGLGWAPKVRLEEGLKRMFEHHFKA